MLNIISTQSYFLRVKHDKRNESLINNELLFLPYYVECRHNEEMTATIIDENLIDYLITI